jgi:hypothetical protein
MPAFLQSMGTGSPLASTYYDDSYDIEDSGAPESPRYTLNSSDVRSEKKLIPTWDETSGRELCSATKDSACSNV